MIHTTAIIDPLAKLGFDVSVGPFAIIDAGAVIGDGTEIGPRVHIHGCCRIGRENLILDGAVLGGLPQSIGFDRDDTGLVIGDKNFIGEFATINRGSKPGSNTTVADGVYLMSYAHIGHDCEIRDGAIITSFAGLSGHCLIEEQAIVGGQGGIHQFVRVGRLAMLGAGSGIGQDLPPYMIAQGHPARAIGPNSIGLRRAGISAEVRESIKKAYKILCRRGLALPAAVRAIADEVEDSPEIRHLLDFLAESKRGIVR